jgi:ATP-dependent helicase/DNAse subunit B
MRLITGPPGSGKTAQVLEEFREALREANHFVRLLVPTATMAQHLENQIAREGFVLRPGLIQTLNGFVEERVTDFPQASEAVLYLLVEEAVKRVNRAEFRRVAHLAGFCARLARGILEFSAAGCDSDRLARRLPDTPLAAAFLAVYQEVDRALDQRGLLLRSKRLECAAARIHKDGLQGTRTIWLDGFHALPDPELAVIQAMGSHADLALTLPDYEATADLRARLGKSGFREERFPKKRPSPAPLLVKAPRMEREVEEIARRILEQAAAGRPFREMGVIVRSEDAYVPLLRATLERFGIPARFYFETNAAQHAAIRFITGAVDAMLGGWDHSATLAALRLAPPLAASPELDRLEFAVREQIPNRGLGTLKSLLTEPEGTLGRFIDQLGQLEELQSLKLLPEEWAKRLLVLSGDRQGAAAITNHESALLSRSYSTALDAFDKALAEAAQALEPRRPLPIEEFWRPVKSVLRLTKLYPADSRRNVVHVMSVYEARQWVLPVVFVCGMVEKQFPQFHTADPFFPDAARQGLVAAGIRVRTRADIELEEHALFESAVSRATVLVTLLYPEFTPRGESNLPSLFLDSRLHAEASRVIRPAVRHAIAPASPAATLAPALLLSLRERTNTISVSALESWLQCPFRYFGGNLLRLRTSPPRSEDRLDFRLQGQIVHEVLARWRAEPQDVAALFEKVFAAYCESESIPQGYHTERLRNAMLEDLERFVADQQWPFQFTSRTEEKFTQPLDDSLQISGRIDRLDKNGDDAVYVIDYKYSAPEQVKKKRGPDQLQGPLYLLAAETTLQIKPAGMFFVALKGGVKYIGWSRTGLLDSPPIPEEWAETKARIANIAAGIRQGRFSPAPSDKKACGYCDSRDICRIEVSQPANLTIAGEGQ